MLMTAALHSEKQIVKVPHVKFHASYFVILLTNVEGGKMSVQVVSKDEKKSTQEEVEVDGW